MFVFFQQKLQSVGDKAKGQISKRVFQENCLITDEFRNDPGSLDLNFAKRQKQPLEVFYKKVVFESFAKFTGKHLCQGLFFNKVAG